MLSWIVFVGIVTFLVFLFITYLKWIQKYWAGKNVPYIKPTSIFGNVDNVFSQKQGIATIIKRSYDEFKERGHKHGGVFFLATPIYIPVDLGLVKSVMAKDFQHFTNRGLFLVNEKADPLSTHLFNLEGEAWKNMRAQLTPTFTSGKMKLMFQTLLDCGAPMLEHVDNLIKNNEKLDIKDILACYTTDVIGSCGFGIDCNSFKNPDADFRNYGRRLAIPTFRTKISQLLRFLAPSLQKIVPFKDIEPDIETFFINTVKNVVDYRRKNGVKRNDFIHILIEMQDKAKANNAKIMTLEEMAAQVFLFFAAGFDTSSTTMSFCLHELAFNQDIQDKLREEVRETLKKNNGVLTYDGIMNMEYMDQVVNETMRKYPPLQFLNRECSLDYKVPDCDVTLEKGTKVFISTFGIHRDEEYYPDAEKFDPDRFTVENKAKRPQFSFLPFGDGPRNCIGLRFGYMQTKTGLSMLLNNYKLRPAKGEKYDMNFDQFSFVLAKEGDIFLNAERLSNRI